MARIEFYGKKSHIARSCLMFGLAIGETIVRRILRKPTHTEWTVEFEIGVLFWRRQYKHALSMPDIRIGRAYLDSFITLADQHPNVNSRVNEENEPIGDWHIVDGNSDLTILYIHGGGNSLYPKMAMAFGKMLADYLHANVFMPDYRLIPEHPHPAQHVDVFAAYQYLLERGVLPQKLVVIGESGGGNLALKLALALRDKNILQPALTICLSPWTGMGKNTESLFGNDKYDVLQGEMLLQFGKPLPGEKPVKSNEISNIELNFKNVSPLYIQAGGSELMTDLIVEFAETINQQGAEITLDIWLSMTHVFQMNGKNIGESADAFERLNQIIAVKTNTSEAIPQGAQTIISSA